jgi:small subunit ribosomal protein S8
MSCTDPIADLLTVIRNGLAANKKSVTVPFSKIKHTKPAKTIQVALKYGPLGEPVIHEIARVSTPGLRQYAARNELKPIIRGFGISILTTSKGILSDRVCRKQRLGGEVLCVVK